MTRRKKLVASMKTTIVVVCEISSKIQMQLNSALYSALEIVTHNALLCDLVLVALLLHFNYFFKKLIELNLL